MRLPRAVPLDTLPPARPGRDPLWKLAPRLHAPRPGFRLQEAWGPDVMAVDGVLNPAARFEAAPEDHFLRLPNYRADRFVVGEGRDVALTRVAKAVGAPGLGLVNEFNVAGGVHVPDDLLQGDLETAARGELKIKDAQVERVQGLSIPFCHYGLQAFAHFTLDGLLQVHLWERELRAGEARLAHWHFPQPWIQDALDALGLPSGAQHRLDGPVALLERAGLSSALAGYGTWYPGAYSRRFFAWLRDRLGGGVPTGARRLYVRRAQQFGRAILNQDELEALALSHGFTPYAPEEHSLPDKIATFGAAGAILSAFGSSLTLAPLIGAPRQVIELLPDSVSDPWFYRQAVVHGLDYLPILHAAQPDGALTADLARIDQVLRALR